MIVALVAFYVIVFLLGVATFAFTFKLFPGLHDRGYSIARILGILLFGYISWMLPTSQLVKFAMSAWIALAVLLIGGIIALVRDKSILQFYKNNRKLFLTIEAIALVSFLAMLTIRYVTPNQGPEYPTWGERFDDFAILNSVARTDYFPAEHPWLAGKQLHYYYFGQIMIAGLAIVSRLSINYVYNVALAMLFSLVVLGSFCIVYNLTKRIGFGVLAAFFTVVIGNFAGFVQVIKQKGLLPYSYWDPSRVFPPGIQEFPFFSFLHADLHAHLIAFPFTLLVIVLALNLFRSKKIEWLNILIASLAVGALGFISSWDFPTYAVFFALVLVFTSLRVDKSVQKLLLRVVVFAAVAVVLFAPYFFSTKGIAHGINKDFMSWWSFIQIYALFAFLVLSVTILQFRKFSLPWLPLIIIGVLAVLGAPVWSLVLALVVILAFLFFKLETDEDRFACLLAIMGLVMIVALERFFVDWRMNTVFKFGLQAWIMLAVASAYFVFKMLNELKGNMRRWWLRVLILLILTQSIYPVAATIQRMSDSPAPTLDGYSLTRHHEHDRTAIEWLNSQPKGVVLESIGNQYSWNARISSLTGFPAVLGWPFHAGQWERDFSAVDQRKADVATMFNSVDVRQSGDLLQKYNVAYVVVGKLERENYAKEGLDKFNNMSLRVVYENPEVMIYKRG